MEGADLHRLARFLYCPAWYFVQIVAQSYTKSEARDGAMIRNTWSVPTIANEVRTLALPIKLEM